MKEFKRILILPFAITAMLFLGALTTSASNVSDVEVASIVLNPTPYMGTVYKQSPLGSSNYVPVTVDPTEHNCTLEPIETDQCFIIENGVYTPLFGVELGDYKPLYQIVE
ncbi:hypothetical protein ACYSNV_04510 [Myroides sp. LJL119]